MGLIKKNETPPLRSLRRVPSPDSQLSTRLVQSKSGCACGGGCPRCDSKLPVQTKLAVSEPQDIYEQEADRVAEQVTGMPAQALQSTGGDSCPTCDTEEGLIQRKTEAAPESLNSGPDGFLNDLGPGQPLDAATMNFFESRFNHDFSTVRLHADAAAAESAQSINALAYTVGRDIVLGPGRYTPGTLEGNKLLAHELTHVVQQSDAGAMRRPMVQRQEGSDDDANAHAREVVINNKNIDVRAQFALLRLLKGPDAETAREMIDEVEKGTLNGIFGDDLKKAADAASQRGKARWELVPPGQDAILINDGLLDAPLLFFKEAAGHFPRLDRALIDAYRARPEVIKEQCPDGRGLPPGCAFNETEKAVLASRLQQARERTREVSQLLTTPAGETIAVEAAKNMFSAEDTPHPTLDEIKQSVNGTLAILESSTIQFVCRTCGDPVCNRPGTVAFVVEAGQMPIFICAFRLLGPEFLGELRRTIIHEAVHLSGIDTDTSKDEKYCEEFAACGGPCHGKDNAESWARYIDCLSEPLTIPPLIMPPSVFPPLFPPPIKLPGQK
ncbi:MAG TPA: DUF4157 domain-containing protein [Pyrinomonadaceae bacterium]